MLLSTQGRTPGIMLGTPGREGLPGRAMLEAPTEGVTMVRRSELWAPLTGIMFMLLMVGGRAG